MCNDLGFEMEIMESMWLTQGESDVQHLLRISRIQSKRLPQLSGCLQQSVALCRSQ